MKRISVLLAFFLLFAAPSWGADKEIPVKGMVTMVDLGSTTCIPCKMMDPVLKNLRKEYKGRAAVFFININEDEHAARKYGLRAIPTQIFYDKNGVEQWRHEGFLSQELSAKQIDKLLESK